MLPGAAGHKKGSRAPLVGGVLLVALVCLVLGLAMTDHRKASVQPVSLLRAVQQEEAARADAGEVAAPSLDLAPPRSALSAAIHRLPPEAVAGAAELRTAGSPTPSSKFADPGVQTGLAQSATPSAPDGRRSAGSRRLTMADLGSKNSDAVELDGMFSKEYGDGGRPLIPGPTTAGGTGPSWLHTAERIDAPPPPKNSFGIPLGAHIRARLKTNLDSAAISDGFVEARLERPFSVNGEVRLPSQTMVYGRASASQGRFNVHFSRMVLPGGREVAIDGLAYDIEERKAGLKASRSTSPAPMKQDGKVTRVAKGAAQVLVGAIGQGDLGTEAAQRAAQETLTDENSSGSSSTGSAYLDAGADFDVFLSQAL